MSCCTYGCTDGPGCPAHQTPADHSRQAFPRYCEASRQPCAEPFQCGQKCQIEATKLAQWQGGVQVDHGLPVQMFEPPSWYQRPAVLYAVVGVGACIGFALYRTFLN